MYGLSSNSVVMIKVNIWFGDLSHHKGGQNQSTEPCTRPVSDNSLFTEVCPLLVSYDHLPTIVVYFY